MYITRERKYTKEREFFFNIALKKNDNEIKIIVKYDKNNRPAKEKRKLLQRLKLMSNRTKSAIVPAREKIHKTETHLEKQPRPFSHNSISTSYLIKLLSNIHSSRPIFPGEHKPSC